MLSEQSEIVNDGRRSKPSVWECSEVIFLDAENAVKPTFRTRKPCSTQGGDHPLPMVADWEILSKSEVSGSVGIADKQKTKSRDETLKCSSSRNNLSVQGSFLRLFL